LKAAVEEVKQSYASIGFAHTKVDYALEDTKPGQVKLKLQIDEGHRFTVGAIRIEGAKVVKQEELKKALRSGVGGPYTEELAERDAMALNAVLFDHGLVQSSVTAVAPGDSPNGAVDLVFRISEGDVYKVGKLKLTGFDLGPEKDVFKSLETKTKTVFSRSAITRDIERLKHLAQQKGASVDVLPLTEVNPKDKTIDLTFSLEKQPEQRIRF
jgi:outer membrane protein insertion porin family